MRRMIPVVLIACAVSATGATSLALSASDTTPGGARTQAGCVDDVHVDNAVDFVAGAQVVTAVDVTGNMTTCVGQTLLVEVDIGNPDSHVNHAYAVWKFTEPTSSLHLTFGPDGDFRDTPPTATDGGLVPAGNALAPLDADAFGLVTVSFAKTWG